MKNKNGVFFGLGTIGRDIFYTLISSYLLTYLSEVAKIGELRLAIVGIILIGLKIFDAVNDPISGWIVDNTHKVKMGKFKFWQLIGMIFAVVFTLLIFISVKAPLWLFIVLFVIGYLGFDIFYGFNDTAYWGMLPSLSTDTEERNTNTSIARFFASIGSFGASVAIVPVTMLFSKMFDANADGFGNIQGWILFFAVASLLLIIFQLFPILYIKENREFKSEDNIKLKDVFNAIFKNKQLLVVAAAILLFQTGFMCLVGFGTYFAKYIIGDEDFYTIFALVLGVSTLIAVVLTPFLAKLLKRKRLFFIGTLLQVVGALMFLIVNIIPLYIVAGVLLFVGQGFTTVLTYAYIQDTIEYGQLQTGKRSEAINLSVQSFINKGASALGGTAIVLLFLFLTQISNNNIVESATDMTNTRVLIFKLGMFGIPLICSIVGFFLLNKFYIIDEKKHAEIVEELRKREESNEQ
ncbi:MAG: glycoside-pentoside-hexuronide (GPH):cation symporter [Bacillales bacterium]|jgi:melibiose permease/lactose/raffinose/galactose permease|nr:glycoside-pentoside-hexuronide (GPH):cation symporter [Bacillales bacterium]